MLQTSMLFCKRTKNATHHIFNGEYDANNALVTYVNFIASNNIMVLNAFN